MKILIIITPKETRTEWATSIRDKFKQVVPATVSVVVLQGEQDYYSFEIIEL